MGEGVQSVEQLFEEKMKIERGGGGERQPAGVN
jgi:hypothetical protein